ncbi:MAG: exodeoxyribonuclease VII small subunit [Saccharospirillum sp.]
MSKQDQPDFEQQMAQLESLVGRLESGDLSLDEAMQTFEQGIQLTRQCQQALDTAEQKVQVLLGQGEDAQLAPMPDQE